MIRFPRFIDKMLTKLLTERQPYLEEAGITTYPGNHFGNIICWGDLRNALRSKRIKRKTGVDPRECWMLSSAFTEWLYTHLCQLLEDTNADLTEKKYKHNGKTYDEGEYIEYLKGLCKQILLFDEFKDCPDIDWELVNAEEGNSEFKTIRWITESEGLKKFREQNKRNCDELTALEKEMFDVFYDLFHALWW